MKTLLQIIEDIKDGERPEYDDLRFAVLALDALLTFESNSLMALGKAKKENLKPVLKYDAWHAFEESFSRRKIAFSKAPKEYIGENNNPDNPEYQKFHRASRNLLNKFQEKWENEGK